MAGFLSHRPHAGFADTYFEILAFKDGVSRHMTLDFIAQQAQTEIKFMNWVS